MADIKKVLEELEWTDGLHIPVANAENIKLENEVQRLLSARAKALNKTETQAVKLEEFRKYLKSLYNEETQNQKILYVQREQLETEKSLCINTKSEKECLNNRVKVTDKECEKVDERKEGLCRTLKKMLQKLDDIKLSIEWDEQAIENYQTEILQKEDDNEAIKKYSREDRKKIEDFELKRQRLQVEEISLKKLIDRGSTDLNEMNLILTRGIQIYRQLHNEMSVFVRQWKGSVEFLHKRDKQIMNLRKEILTMEDSDEIECKTKNEVEKELDQVIASNQNKRLDIKKLIGERSFFDEDLHNLKKKVQEYRSELTILKLQLARFAGDGEKSRIKLKQIESRVSDSHDILSELREDIHTLNYVLKRVDVYIKHTNNYKSTLEEILNEEENITKTLVKKQKYFYLRERALTTERDDLTRVTKDLESSTRLYTRFVRKIKDEKKKYLKLMDAKHKVIYKMDYCVNKWLRKRSDVEVKCAATERRCHEESLRLDQKHQQTDREITYVRHKLNEIFASVQRIGQAVTDNRKVLLQLKEDHSTIVKVVDLLETETSQSVERTQQLITQETIVKMKIKHTESILYKHGMRIFEAKRYQLELDTAMKQKITEIEKNKKIFMVAKNGIVEQQREIKKAITSTRARLNVLKARYETILKSFGKIEDGEEVPTPAYFALKIFEEKTMLQIEGDKLDNQIRQAEQEIIAMENTLKVVNITNENYKKTLSTVDENDEAQTQFKLAEEELSEETSKLVDTRDKLKAHQVTFRELHEEMENIESRMNDSMKEIMERETKFTDLQRESEYRQVKIERAKKQIKKILANNTIDENLQKDFITYKLREHNCTVFQQLSETRTKYLETKPNINRYLSEKSLSMPSSSCLELKPALLSTSGSTTYSTPSITSGSNYS